MSSSPHSEHVLAISEALQSAHYDDPPDETKVVAGKAALDNLVEQFESKRRSLVLAETNLGYAEERMRELQEQLGALLKVAEGLFQMIDRETWRANGGDDQQGHYEGDYRAAQIEEYLVGLRASNPASEPCADSSLLNWGSHLLRGESNQDQAREVVDPATNPRFSQGGAYEDGLMTPLDSNQESKPKEDAR